MKMSLPLSSSFFSSLPPLRLSFNSGPLFSHLSSWMSTWTQSWPHIFTRPWSSPSYPLYLTLFISYLALVRILRYRRRDTLPHKYNYTTRASFSRMTDDEAMLILRDLALLEFPKMYSLSIFMALFKTYGILTISSLLLSTKQFSSTPLQTSKRAADTGVLLTEIVFNSPASDRHIEALSRMNYLHDRYRSAGKISDGDMLYTLSLFALEPSRWIGRYEWRGLSQLERCATGVFFREMGRGMGIPFGGLAEFMSEDQGEGEQTGEVERERGWGKDGLEWMEALERWSELYERDKMVYSESNQRLAKLTLELGLFSVPGFMRGFVMGIIGAVLEPRLRVAVAIPPPSKTHRMVLTTLVETRKFVLRHLALPRPEFLRMKYFTDEVDPATGRYHALRYRAHPWYVKPSFWSRWGVSALMTRFLLGGLLPGDDGDVYRPGGYKIREVGPDGLEGKGAEEMDKMGERLRRERRGGCPMGLR